MASRVVYSYGGGEEFRVLFAGLLTAQLLAPAENRPLYLVAPVLADVPAIDNAHRQVAALLPAYADQEQIWLSDVLGELATGMEIRLVTRPGDQLPTLLSRPAFQNERRPAVRLIADTSHLPNGLLGGDFFLDGVLRLTMHGPMIDGERVVLHTAESDPAARAIAAARSALDRIWPTLAEAMEVPDA